MREAEVNRRRSGRQRGWAELQGGIYRDLSRIIGIYREIIGRWAEAELRGGAALVTAGLAAEGITTVQGVGHIHRGYEELPAHLRALGAHITEEN